MAKVIWSLKAKYQRAETLKYWNNRNGNTNYSQKINAEIKHTLNLIKENLFIGVEVAQRENVRRILVLPNYAIFYTFEEETIYILSFWDNRQNPDEFTFT